MKRLRICQKILASNVCKIQPFSAATFWPTTSPIIFKMPKRLIMLNKTFQLKIGVIFVLTHPGTSMKFILPLLVSIDDEIFITVAWCCSFWWCQLGATFWVRGCLGTEQGAGWGILCCYASYIRHLIEKSKTWTQILVSSFSWECLNHFSCFLLLTCLRGEFPLLLPHCQLGGEAVVVPSQPGGHSSTLGAGRWKIAFILDEEGLANSHREWKI